MSVPKTKTKQFFYHRTQNRTKEDNDLLSSSTKTSTIDTSRKIVSAEETKKMIIRGEPRDSIRVEEELTIDIEKDRYKLNLESTQGITHSPTSPSAENNLCALFYLIIAVS